jgi:hypothetical protein
MTAPSSSTFAISHTRQTLFLANILQEPFIAFNLLFDVILSRHFDASAIQISLLTTLRPLLAVFAFYWGSLLLFKPNLLRPSLVVATAFATSFFLFAPWYDNIGYFILAEGCFVLFWRATTPAQMEILKLNVPKGSREPLLASAFRLSRILGMVIGPLLGLFLQFYPHLWKELFCTLAFCYALSALLKGRFLVPSSQPTPHQTVAFKEFIIKPWIDSWHLLKKNRSFMKFQIGFFIAGSGLMFAKPSIPSLFEHLNLSFFQIFTLFTLLEGLGYVLTSALWAKHLATKGLHTTSCFVIVCFAMQPLFLLTPWFWCLFPAYFFYGAAQAGSQLVWNLSGPLLCGNESSTQYSSVNILAIGVRGCFVPLLGGLFSALFGPHLALAFSLVFMIAGSLYLFKIK